MKITENQSSQKTIQCRFYLFITILSIFICFSCSKSDDNDNPPTLTFTDGSMQELRAFYNDGFVDAMITMGFTFNLGNTPPNIEGGYVIDPFILNYSTVASYMGHEGEDFGSYLPSFSNQNNSALTIDYLGQSGSGGQTDNGNGSFIMGSNGAFSVYSKNNTTVGSATAITAVAISGVITANGIENVQLMGAMLDNNGNQVLIPNNTGSLYIDGDGLAEEQ